MHYAPHSHRKNRKVLPFPHPHVGRERLGHVAKRAAINLAWGIEVGRVASRMGLSIDVATDIK